MRTVKNRKLIRSLTFRTMKEKKGKNLIAVLAIALTSLLFTTLFTVGGSLFDSIEEATMRQVGTSAHVGYKRLTVEEYEKLKAAGGYQDISYDIIAGFAGNPELQSIQTEVRYSQDQQAKWAFSYPEAGTMPREKMDCAVSTKVLEALGLPLELGTKVPLSIISHDAEGQEVILEGTFNLCGYWYSNDASMAQEVWISEEWVKKNVPLLTQNYEERLQQTGKTNMEGSLQVSVKFRSSFDLETQAEQLIRQAGLDPEKVKAGINWAYATASVDGTTMLLGAFLLLLILLSGYLIIYNIFYINVTTDIRYYGLLKTIGTTGRQLKRMVRGEALWLSMAGIPLGLLAGWFVGKGLLPMIYRTLNTSGVRNVVLNPWIFAGSAVFSLLVVSVSCRRPCRLAARVSPVEAVRYTESAGYRRKERKTREISLFRMAAANLGRNRKKTVLVILSLSLSLTMLSGTWCLVRGFDPDLYIKSYLTRDMQISHYSTRNFSAEESDFEAMTPELVSEVEQIDGVEAVYVPKNRSGLLTLSQEAMEHFKAFREQAEQKEAETATSYVKEIYDGIEERGNTNLSSYQLPEEFWSELAVVEGTFDQEKFADGGYALLLADEGEEAGEWLQVGDRITAGSYQETAEESDGSLMAAEENAAAEKQPEKTLEIMAKVQMPYALTTRVLTVGGARVILCKRDFEQLYSVKGGLYLCLDVEEGKEQQVAKRIESLLEEKYPALSLMTKETLTEEFAEDTTMFSLIGGFLSVVLALIGILNFMNAMLTSILSRRQEFAMMQAVGMTGRQLSGMLMLEGIWYGIWVLLVTATLGNLFSYGLIYLVGRNMSFFVWHFDLTPLLLGIPVMGILAVILPLLSYQGLCKKSIIERLRLSEV